MKLINDTKINQCWEFLCENHKYWDYNLLHRPYHFQRNFNSFGLVKEITLTETIFILNALVKDEKLIKVKIDEKFEYKFHESIKAEKMLKFKLIKIPHKK